MTTHARFSEQSPAFAVQPNNGGWLALSDHAVPVCAEGIEDVVQSGALILEISRPKDSDAVLLDHQCDHGWTRGFSIFYGSDAGIVIRHRQGDTIHRLCLPGPLPRDWDMARLTYCWNGPGRAWSITLQDIAGAWRLAVSGMDPMPMTGRDLLALCSGSVAARRHVSVNWFGVCRTAPDHDDTYWIGCRTPVDTARGPAAAGDLRVGDKITTWDREPQVLTGLRRMILPNRGRLAPVLLRAPYFARQIDLLVAQAHLILMAGTAVEYLFGEDAVLAPAAALRDGNSALTDMRRLLSIGIALEFDTPQLIVANGCAMMCATKSDTARLPYRLIHDYEAMPLQSMLGRVGPRATA